MRILWDAERAKIVKMGYFYPEHRVAKLSAPIVVQSTSYDSSQVKNASIRYSPSSMGLSQEEQPQEAVPGLARPGWGLGLEPGTSRL